MSIIVNEFNVSLQRQFYGMDNLILYNMFNHHFFERLESQSVYEKFLVDGKNKIALVMDPPFGGKAEVIANTLDKIAADYKQLNKLNSCDISSEYRFNVEFHIKKLKVNYPET